MTETTYFTNAKDYETRVIDNARAGNFVPAYGESKGLSYDGVLCDTVEAALKMSLDRMGDDWYLFGTAFADYLFEQHHVPDVDCELIAAYCMYCITHIADVTAKVTVDRFKERLADYIDWDRYFTDHPEEAK